MTDQQGLRQASVRAVTGTNLGYNGDFMSLFAQAGITSGDFNGQMLAWINLLLGTTYDNLPGAMAAFAIANNATNFASVGTFNADPIVIRNAVSLFAPGHGTNLAPVASTGVAVNYSPTFTNNSGAPITDIGVVLIGWQLRSIAPGYTDVGNTVPTTINVEYPVGTVIADITQSGSTTINNLSGATPTASDSVTLSTPIPAGASFKLNLSNTMTAGLKYPINLGLTAVTTKANKSTLKKECLYIIGDSIATNNSAVLGIINNKCPVSQMSITGTRADLYSGDFVRQTNLAAAIGATRVVSDFSVNDTNASQAAATTRDVLLSMQTAMTAKGIKWTQTTQTPQSTMLSVTPSSVTSSGTTMTIVVPDGTLFDVGQFYTLSGATQTEYNITLYIESISTNTLTCPFVGSATPTATGTMVIQSAKAANTRKFQVPGGAKAVRDALNTYIRSGIFTGGYIDWGDALEKTRGDNIFWSGNDGDTRSMPPQGSMSITGIINSTRFNTQTILSGASGLTGGLLICLNGANRGKMAANVNGNGTTDITATIPTGGAAWTIGDTFAVLPGSCTITDDRLHPRVAIANKGGQQFLVDVTSTWIDALLA